MIEDFGARLLILLHRIRAPFGWIIRPIQNGNEYYLQIECLGKCNYTNEKLTWKGRKWRLSVHMTDGEVVQTALMACLAAGEHEIREQFKYREVSIFDPHYDIEKLVELRKQPDSIKERD